MIHEMKLQPEYFNFILNGTKRIEIRLNDEKRIYRAGRIRNAVR